MNYFFIENSINDIVNLSLEKKISQAEIISIVKENYSNDPNYAWECFNCDMLDTGEYPVNSNLLNIPFGTKDIFNTVKFPTSMGSEIWKDFTPGNNARVVDSILNSGGINVGKTVTAEFAVHELNKTLNPYNHLKTPGTSSSGSAVSVSTGTVPFALATQTAGSISRPASYCGVWGFKPSFGLVPRTGVLKTTDTLDQIGFITSNGKNLRILLDTIRVKGPNYPYVYNNIDNKTDLVNKKKWKVGFIKTYTWKNCKGYVKDSIENFLKILENEDDITLEEIDFPSDFQHAHEMHAHIYNKSLAYYFQKESKYSPDKISNIMNSMMSLGEQTSLQQFDNALNEQIDFASKIDDIFSDFDVLISHSTAESAPMRGETEKDDSSLLWTLAMIPAISAPLFRCPENMPFNLHFLSSRWKDYHVISFIENLIKKEMIEPECQKLL